MNTADLRECIFMRINIQHFFYSPIPRSHTLWTGLWNFYKLTFCKSFVKSGLRINIDV